MQHLAKIFSGTGSQYLAEKIAQQFGTPMGKVNIQRFSDGDIQTAFYESIRGDMVFLVQITFAPAENLLELLLIIDAARRAIDDDAHRAFGGMRTEIDHRTLEARVSHHGHRDQKLAVEIAAT